MTLRSKKFIFKTQITRSNRIPKKRAQQFLMGRMRDYRVFFPSAPLRAGLSFVHWLRTTALQNEDRVPYRTSCFLTGRFRGLAGRRFSFVRMKLKPFSAIARVHGLRKSSW